MAIITLAAIVPDFDSGIGAMNGSGAFTSTNRMWWNFLIGITTIFALAEQFNTTTGVINNLTSKYVDFQESS